MVRWCRQCGAGDGMCDDDDDDDDDGPVQMLWSLRIPKPLGNLPQGISNTFQDLFSLHAQTNYFRLSGSDPGCNDPYPHLKALEDAVDEALDISSRLEGDTQQQSPALAHCFPSQVRPDHFLLRFYTLTVKALLLLRAFTIWTRKGGAGCPGGPDSSHLAPSNPSAHLNNICFPDYQQYMLHIRSISTNEPSTSNDKRWEEAATLAACISRRLRQRPDHSSHPTPTPTRSNMVFKSNDPHDQQLLDQRFTQVRTEATRLERVNTDAEQDDSLSFDGGPIRGVMPPGFVGVVPKNKGSAQTGETSWTCFFLAHQTALAQPQLLHGQHYKVAR